MRQKLNLFILMFTVTLLVMGQSKKEEELYDQFWKTENKDAKVTQVPKKWQNESSVILFQDEYYRYTNNGKKMYKTSYSHFRVQLLDDAALEKYSSISLEKDRKIGMGFVNYKRDRTTVGIKIIKADGSESVVDVNDIAVEQDQERKIAIPGLQIGDIIDCFIYEDDYERSVFGTKIYAPTERVLSAESPILYSRIAVEVENDYYLNMESYNGAPSIKEEETDRRATRRYVLENSNIEKSDFPRWFYPLSVLPTVKFQVTFALKSKNEEYAQVFLSQDDAERKYKVTPDEVLEYYDKRFKAYKKVIKDPVRYIEDQNITNKREQMVEALYYARHHSYNKFLEIVLASDGGIGEFFPCDDDYTLLNENTFVFYMAGIAKALEIEYDIIVATRDYDGPIEDLLLRQNVVYGLRFNFDEPLYLFNLESNVQPDYFPENLEGTEAYIMSVKKNRKLETITTEKLPVTSAQENLIKEVMEVTIKDDLKTLSVNRNTSYTGHFKINNLLERTFFGDFINEEFERYNSKHFYHCKKKLNKWGEDKKNKMEALLLTFREKKEERLSELVGNNFDSKIDDYSYTVPQFARYSNKPLIINDTFGLEGDYLKKAGNNYILSLGKLIGGQVNIDKEEMKREAPININHAKTFEYEVNLEIPKGYTVVGLEKLKINKSNGTGSFISEATMANGQLILKTKKVYNKRAYEPSEWKDMVDWLSAAYNLSQEKVLLKKI